jgi:hypothetical protein
VSGGTSAPQSRQKPVTLIVPNNRYGSSDCLPASALDRG